MRTRIRRLLRDQDLVSSICLLLGIGLTTGMIGFMVGASSSPVIGAVVPVTWGAIGAVLSFFLQKDQAETGDSHSTTLFSRQVKLALGATLICASVFYGVGFLAGTQARINAWLIPDSLLSARLPERHFPWDDQTQPFYIDGVLKWLLVQEELLGLGYSEQDVQALYKNYVSNNDVMARLWQQGADDKDWPYERAISDTVLETLLNQSSQDDATASLPPNFIPSFGKDE